MAKILTAGRQLMLTKGYHGTSVEDVCREAGVTKGALFHHFSGKESLAVALLQHHWEVTQQMLSRTPYGSAEDPLQRLFLYVDLFIALGGMVDMPPASCLFGNLTQELGMSESAIVTRCHQGFEDWSAQISRDLEASRERYETTGDWNPDEVARYFISLYEGSLILAKAGKKPKILGDNMLIFRHHLQSLFVFRGEKPKPRTTRRKT